MDFDNPKVHGDTSITDGLVFKVILQLSEASFPVSMSSTAPSSFFCNAKNCFCEVKKSDQDAKTAFQSHTCERGLAQKQFGFHWVCWPTLCRLLHTKKVISRYKMDNEVDEKAFKELAAFVIEAIVIPVLAVFGIAGNLFLVDWDPIRHVGTFCFLPWSSQRSTKPSKIRVSQFV